MHTPDQSLYADPSFVSSREQQKVGMYGIREIETPENIANLYAPLGQGVLKVLDCVEQGNTVELKGTQVKHDIPFRGITCTVVLQYYAPETCPEATPERWKEELWPTAERWLQAKHLKEAPDVSVETGSTIPTFSVGTSNTNNFDAQPPSSTSDMQG